MLNAVAAGSRRGTGRRRALRNVLVAVLVIAAVVLVVGVVQKTRDEARLATLSSRQYTPPPMTTPSPAPLPVVAVIGDDTTSQAASGVTAAQRWTSLLGADADVQVRTFASAGAGYATRGSDGRTFLDQASRVPEDAAVVVVFGGISDLGESELRLSRAASQTISAIQTRAPDARIAIVGPVTDDGAPTVDVTELRTTLQNAAGAFDLSITDPIQQAWLNGSPNDASDLAAADQRTLAQRFATVVTRLLPATT